MGQISKKPDVHHQRVAAIVVAAGSSERMRGVDKVFVEIAQRPLLAYSVQILEDAPEIDEIVLVVNSRSIERAHDLSVGQEWRKVREIIVGGERRQDSVRKGLEILDNVKWVVVHDGARPRLTRHMLLRGFEAARETGAAVAAVPVKDTIKVVQENYSILETPPRDQFWIAQTPQIFRKTLLSEAHQHVTEDVTDDASMVELMRGKVKVFVGSYDNIKVTTTEDLAFVETLLTNRVAVTEKTAL